MPVTLPADLIEIIAQHGDMGTQSSLAVTSRNAYFVSVRTLYASIPDMNVTRTTQCLLTLSKNPELAHMVRSFYFVSDISPHLLQGFFVILRRALSNMKNLHTLSLDVDEPTTMDFSKHISGQLTQLHLTTSKGRYPISEFLLNQPAIEVLHIICDLDDISALSSEALPALKKLTAPLPLLSKLLPSRWSRLSQLFVLGVIDDLTGWIDVSRILTLPNPPESLELGIYVMFNTVTMPASIIALGLGSIGKAAPFISLLVFGKHGHSLVQHELRDIFTAALPCFPKLEVLVLMTEQQTPEDSSLNNGPALASAPNSIPTHKRRDP
ncbi:hypothetical protein RSOLAG22IIIB_11221 [Rhizoctonia solani]|uniref:F-box domain-containing protein n=1 Tax=Rhizoctonia solani TaxID=456999 RepID=A0A0K6G7M6_9AGAM|nr:hypothetical protein RSOLAG22IIIB_11221 [Rhizoctonia solani]